MNQIAEALACLQRAYAGLRTDEPFAPNLVVDYLYAMRELKHFEEGLRVIEQAGWFCQHLPDFHLVCGLFYLELVRRNPAQYASSLPNIEQRFQRCLALGETAQYKSVAGTGSFLAYYNLGLFYHVFDEADAARQCFERAAAYGCEPARQMLATLVGSGRPTVTRSPTPPTTRATTRTNKRLSMPATNSTGASAAANDEG